MVALSKKHRILAEGTRVEIVAFGSPWHGETGVVTGPGVCIAGVLMDNGRHRAVGTAALREYR